MPRRSGPPPPRPAPRLSPRGARAGGLETEGVADRVGGGGGGDRAAVVLQVAPQKERAALGAGRVHQPGGAAPAFRHDIGLVLTQTY